MSRTWEEEADARPFNQRARIKIWSLLVLEVVVESRAEVWCLLMWVVEEEVLLAWTSYVQQVEAKQQEAQDNQV